MKYRNIGNSGIQVSEIGLGSWVTFGTSLNQREAESIIDTAYDLGINFFDTANFYHDGEAERIMGNALKKYPRDSYVLATKVYFPMGKGPNNKGLSRKHIIEQCDASLKRLGVEYIDLYQCHRFDPNTPLEETIRALDDLITQGKILYAGVSKWSASQIHDSLKISKEFNFNKIISNQPPYNMFSRDIEKDVIPFCDKEGIGQLVYSPLAQGILTGKYTLNNSFPKNSRATNHSISKFMHPYLNNEIIEKSERLNKLAQNRGVTLSQLSLAWILRLRNISSCIIGATRPEHVLENAKAIETLIDKDCIYEIENILQSKVEFIK
ncbi:aldo/keto reductase family protein [Bacillus wiedmannii]|uniref:aldo/keto reductase family protein n=1 Tax=Bacillus wiedmannii TaxID=1890302 RepID=UPI000BFB32D1|nr:aldo/keto reductase family protein [Bacillus wiedmannii]PHF04987.1 aldo/keto reductase [Bacillus wiedmannii]